MNGVDGQVPDLMMDKGSHNVAYDSAITRGPARVWEWIADPLIENIYGPIAEKNHTLGVVAVNGTLTLPRIPLEYGFGRLYEYGLYRKDTLGKVLANVAIVGKLGTEASDGIDGPVARGTDTASQIGAILDPAADMYGAYDSGKRIKTQARAEGDFLTVALMNIRLGVDAGIAIASGAELLAQNKLKTMGHEVPDNERAKAGVPGKIKFTLSAPATTAHLASYNTDNADAAKKLIRTGQTLTGASIVAGVISIAQHSRSAVKKWRLVRELQKAA